MYESAMSHLNQLTKWAVNMNLRRKSAMLSIGATAVLLLGGCSSGGTTSTSGPQVAADAFDAELVAAARKEGEVVYYTVQPHEEAELIAKGFQATFNIPVRLIRDDTGGVIRQIEAQVAAGAVTADVVVLPDQPVLRTWHQDGITEAVTQPNSDSYLPGLVNPEIGALPMGSNLFGVAYNTLNSEPPASWEEVAEGLDGPIAMADPNGSGAAVMAYSEVSKILGDDWLERVVQNNEILTADSAGTTHQMLLTGEVNFAIPGVESHTLRSKDRGEPLDVVYMEEGVIANTMDVAKLADAPHSAAAELLINYQLHPGVQQALTEKGGRSVLTETPPPTGGQDVSNLPWLQSDVESYAADRDKIRAIWSRVVG